MADYMQVTMDHIHAVGGDDPAIRRLDTVIQSNDKGAWRTVARCQWQDAERIIAALQHWDATQTTVADVRTKHS